MNEMKMAIEIGKMIKATIICLIIFISANLPSSAQTTSQVWTDFLLNVPMKKGYTFDNEFSYKTELTKPSTWRSLDVTPEIEKSFGNKLDVDFFIGSSYTIQQESYDTWEIKPGLGARYHFTPGRKVLLRAFGRFEQRNLYTVGSKTWEHDARTRLRLESIFFLNGKSFAKDYLWYSLADVEFFWTIDKQVQERYSNRSRIRAGVGYKLNRNWRFEGIYTYQFSKTTIEGEFNDNEQQIFRFRVKYYTK